MNPVSGDVICLSGSSFCCKDNTRSLVGFARTCQGEAFRVLFDVGPMVADIEPDVLQTVNGLHPIWSLNESRDQFWRDVWGANPTFVMKPDWNASAVHSRWNCIIRRFSGPVPSVPVAARPGMQG